ncbi:uncharacterized protein LOC117337333 [Pecten maximus]|uniref:uncharacterized protein LOC117337333 n=1 Tax=Pecten maximus TaxID=6579 RepID=UPI0014584536|nr:uncharacterized protein LOC117337333 [Pecten maximus]
MAEGKSEEASSLKGILYETTDDGNLSNQTLTFEEVSEGGTSKECGIQKEEPEGAIYKHGEADMSEYELAWRWTKDLIKKPSKEVIKLMKDNPGLISQRITIECKDGCTCSSNFERLEFDAALSRNDTLLHLQTLIERGHCPHLFVDTVVSSHKDLKPSETTTVKTLVRAQTANNIVRSKQPYHDQSADTVLAGITAFHIASIFGKIKIVEHIVLVLEEINRYIVECDEMKTNVHKYDPYYLAVFHRQDQVLRLLGSFISISMARSLMYKKVLQNSVRLAVKDDNIRSLKILLSACHCKYDYSAPHRDIHSALHIAIKNLRVRCLKYLCEKGTAMSSAGCLDEFFSCWCQKKDESISDMFLREDNTVVEELFRLGGVKCRQILLFHAVFYDNIAVTSFILKNYKKMLSQKRINLRIGIPVIIQAVLNNSTSILEILLQSDYVSANITYKEYSALDWARALQFDQCALLLEKAGVPHNKDLPLLMLFEENIASFYHSKSVLVHRLLQQGKDINAESVSGKTALNAAIETQTYSVVRQLLMAGADPFSGQNSLGYFMSRRLLGELLYANVDILQRRTGVSVIHKLLFSFPSLHCQLMLILNHAHTISKSDLKLLNSLHDSKIVSRDILDQIDNYLETPRSLVLRSRDVIRRHFGYRIHDFVRICYLPTQIKSILTLDGILDSLL